MDYKLDHKCEHLKAPKGWAAIFTLSSWGADGYVQLFLDSEKTLVFSSEEEAKERNRKLARNWLSSNDPEGRIFEDLPDKEQQR